MKRDPARFDGLRYHMDRAPWRVGDRAQVSLTSGCQRRRRKAAERRQAWRDGTYGVLVVEIEAHA